MLYAFSRNCCTRDRSRPERVPHSTRDGSGKFQVESYQSLPAGTDPVGRGRAARRTACTSARARRSSRTTTPPTRSAPAIVIPGVDTAISGMHFTPDGKDLLVTSHLNVLYRVSTATWTVRPGLVVRPLAVRLRRSSGVALVGDQLFVVRRRRCGRSATRCATAIFVFDIVDGTGAPAASFTASPDHRHRAGRDHVHRPQHRGARPRGSGTSATARPRRVARPTHTYTTAGHLLASPSRSPTPRAPRRTTQPNLVNVAVNPPLLNAKFSGEPDERRARRCRSSSPTRSVGGVTGWAWDFGDGATSTEQNPRAHLRRRTASTR